MNDSPSSCRRNSTSPRCNPLRAPSRLISANSVGANSGRSVHTVCSGNTAEAGSTEPPDRMPPQKTQRPVQFEITEQIRSALAAWIHQAQLRSEDCLFPSRLHTSDHLSTRQYARIVKGWVKAIGLDPAMYGTHTMRRTKASLIYRRTNNLRGVQLLLAIRSWRAPFDILGLRSMTPWRWRSRLKFNHALHSDAHKARPSLPATRL